jgi:hypothetical protein
MRAAVCGLMTIAIAVCIMLLTGCNSSKSPQPGDSAKVIAERLFSVRNIPAIRRECPEGTQRMAQEEGSIAICGVHGIEAERMIAYVDRYLSQQPAVQVVSSTEETPGSHRRVCDVNGGRIVIGVTAQPYKEEIIGSILIMYKE